MTSASRRLHANAFLTCFFALVWLSPSCFAQNQDVTNPLNIGFPPHGVFSGSDFDSVQVNNGNLHVEIPLWSMKGRSLSVGFKYIYDNKGWYFDTVCDRQGICHDHTLAAWGNNMAWTLVGPTGYAFHDKYVLQQCGSGTYGTHTYTMQDTNGTKHQFLPRTEGLPCFPALGTAMYADDGSGWKLKVDSSSGAVLSATSQTGTVVHTNSDLCCYSSATVVEDANGNQLINNTDGSFTDTLGRNIPSGLSYYDSSGNLQNIQVTLQTVSIQTSQCTFSTADICAEYIGTWNAPHQITLPGNNLTYTINYPTTAGYGEPTSITFPSGGQVSYTYTNVKGGRSVATRTETANGQSFQWTYGYGAGNTDPAGNVTVPTCTFFQSSLAQFSPSCYITKTLYYQGGIAPANLLKTVTTGYTPVVPGTTGGNNWGSFIENSDTTTWNQQNLVTQNQTDWDSVGSYPVLVRNPIEKREYAFGTGASGGLVRRTHYAYLHNSNSAYANLNILDPVTSKVVYDGSGNTKAQTTYAYDGTTTTSTGGTPAPNHDYTNLSSSFNTRGNLTMTSQGLLVSGSWTWLNTVNTYDDLGNVLSTKDPRLNTTNFSYADNWTDTACTIGTNTFAFLTTTTDPLSHQTKHNYFRCTGLVASSQDQNDINAARAGTTFTYDSLNRPLATNYPDGGQTTMSYVDTAPLKVTRSKLVNANLYLQHAMVFDDLGRPLQGQFNDPDCGGGSGLVKVDHAYGFTTGAGRFTKVSTPYCNTPDSTYGLMATTNYDALDRVTSVIQTDGSTVTMTYSGNSAGLTNTVTDEAGKKRTNQTDALGRLTAVFEDPTSLNYESDYGYDTLDNLTSVTQQGGAASGSWRTRSFTYDSLSRLTCAANPEITPGLSTVNPAACPASYTGTYTNGTIGYTYDADSNLITKTAPAPNQTSTSSTVTTNYAYDALNRLTQKSYTGSPTTATAKYGYDGVALSGCTTTPPTLSPADANPVGYRSSMCDGSGATSFSHDPLGRILNDQRIINGTSAINKSVQYTYYKDSELNKLTYPSSRLLTYTLKTGGSCNGGTCTSGRPISVGDGTTNYVSAAVYAPHGAPASFTQDASIHAGFSYNSRLQPLQMAFGTGTLPSLTATTCPTGANIMHRLYDFHSAAATDNGNVQVINNCRDSNRTQNFFYDNLNRITQAYTNGNSPLTTSWGETFTIDAWGNLTNKGPVSGKTNTEALNAAPASTKNQLNGFCNDAAGNMVLNTACPTGTFTPTYSYDIENRLTSTSGWTYVYDGDGERVKKCNSCSTSAGGTMYWPSSAADTVLETDLAGTRKYEYMFFNGERIARRDGSNPPYYYFSDHLKSTDVVTNNSGAIQDESDYFPYGGEIVLSNLAPQNYKFNGKERDSESGLDEFGARYHSSSLSRFMTADWAAKPTDVPYANFGNPQSLNLFSYVQNNPTTLGDPDGHGFDSPLDQDPEHMERNYGASPSEQKATAQALLTGASFIPGAIGRVSALLSAGISFLSGDKKGAAISAMGAVPLGGLSKLSKAEQLAANAAKGAQAEKAVAATLKAEGREILGTQVGVRTSQGLRKVDVLTKDTAGQIANVEVKSGNATRTASQLAKDTEIANQGGTYVGKNAPSDMRGQPAKVPTEVRKPD